VEFYGFAAARLSGPYLAGTTLALAVGLPSLANQFSILGGEQGIYLDPGLLTSATRRKLFSVQMVLLDCNTCCIDNNVLACKYFAL